MASSLLVAILLLGNLQFGEVDHSDVSVHISNIQVLNHVARLLGISSDLSLTLTNKTSHVRKDLYTSLLNAEQSAARRDHLVRDLYAILAFIVETANHKIAPNLKDPAPPTQIILFDQAGHQTKGTAGTGSMSFPDSMPLLSASSSLVPTLAGRPIGICSASSWQLLVRRHCVRREEYRFARLDFRFPPS
jgi:chitin synthase